MVLIDEARGRLTSGRVSSSTLLSISVTASRRQRSARSAIPHTGAQLAPAIRAQSENTQAVIGSFDPVTTTLTEIPAKEPVGSVLGANPDGSTSACCEAPIDWIADGAMTFPPES